jgi:c(7)-type cytochrome triheme protein
LRKELPGHRPCAACHSQKFAALSGPICTVCHTSAACTTCHKPASRGAALSIPSGATAHATCYQCHTSRTQADGRDLSSCGICHAPGRNERVSMSAKAYRVNFSHAEHRQKLNCSNCHRAKSGAPQDQMTQPVPAMHHGSAQAQSCKSCHNNQRAFGGDDFSDCKRCHQGQTFRF